MLPIHDVIPYTEAIYRFTAVVSVSLLIKKNLCSRLINFSLMICNLCVLFKKFSLPQNLKDSLLYSILKVSLSKILIEE